MSLFEVGALVRVRTMSSHPTGWREPKTGVVVGPSVCEYGQRYVPVLVDGTVEHVNEMKIKRVE